MCQRFVVQSVGTKFTYLLYSLTESSTGYWQTLTPRIEGNINIVGYVVETEQLVGRIYLSGEDLQIPTGMSTGIWTCRRAKIFISSLIKNLRVVTIITNWPAKQWCLRLCTDVPLVVFFAKLLIALDSQNTLRVFDNARCRAWTMKGRDRWVSGRGSTLYANRTRAHPSWSEDEGRLCQSWKTCRRWSEWWKWMAVRDARWPFRVVGALARNGRSGARPHCSLRRVRHCPRSASSSLVWGPTRL